MPTRLKKNLTPLPRQPKWLAARCRAASRLAIELPSPNFRYGLNIGFDAMAVRLPNPTAAAADMPNVATRGGVRILPLADVWREPALAAALKRHLGGRPLPSRRWAAQAAARGDGWLVYVPAGEQGTARLDSRLEGRRDLALNLIVIVENRAALTLTRHLSSTPGFAGGRTATLEASLGTGARAKIATIQDLGRRAASFEYRRAVIGRRAEMDWLDGDFGGHFVSRDSRTDVVGADAQVRCQALHFGGGRQQFDFSESIRHAAPRGVSLILGRGALDGTAKSVLRGLIRAEAGAKGCQGKLKTATLLVSETAESDAVPVLEILEPDVKFSHGHAAGRLDADKLFYLMSRGLCRRDAERRLTEAFLAPSLAALRGAGLEETISCLIARRFQKPKKYDYR